MALALSLASGAATAESAAGATFDVQISGARSDKGVIRLAVCPPQSGFPDCKTHAVRSASLPIAGGKSAIRLTGVPDGTYAIGVFHDANGNGKLDTFVGIPREGFGFSRNPSIKPRAPRFDETKIEITNGGSTAISLRYLL